MRKPRTLVPIPRHLGIAIDKVAGQKQRVAFIINLVERKSGATNSEVFREAEGTWKDEDHPQLAEGADKWVREMREEAGQTIGPIKRHRDPR